jgi:hypothetical protein
MGGANTDMLISSEVMGWDPSTMLTILKEEDVVQRGNNGSVVGDSSAGAYQSLEGQQRNKALTSQFKSRVGGLQPQIDAIVRRVLDGRSIYSSTDGNNDNSAIQKSRLEAEELALLGLQPVRGLLLYGKPGVGKTLLVREIARALGELSFGTLAKTFSSYH